MAVAPAGQGAQGRFGSSTDEDISQILDENDALGTKKATKSSLMCLQQYITETNNEINFDNYSTQELSSLLVNFYADARKKNGEKYKLSALKSIRFGHFCSEHNIDIIKDPAFRKANDVFKAVSVGLKRIGLAKVDHTPPIEENELKQIYCSSALTTKTSEGLQLEVWFDIMYFLCRRGRENLRNMNRETFGIAKDHKNREYVYQHVDELDKHHRENADPNRSGTDGRMYSVPGHRLCPVQSFKDYLAKLNPGNEWLWQRLVDSFDEATRYWYTNQVLGKNTLAGMLKTICRRVGLEQESCNHSVRATSITVLDTNRFSNRDIMSVSGHRSASSLKTYTSRVSVQRNHEISKALTDAVLIPENACTDNENTVNNEHDEVSMNDVESDIVVDGVINLTPAEITEFMMPMNENCMNVVVNVAMMAHQDSDNQANMENMVSIPTNNQTIATSVKPEPPAQTMSDVTNVLKCISNNTMGFTPYITGCVVNFNVNCSK